MPFCVCSDSLCVWLRATLPAWKIKLVIGYTLKGKEFIRRRRRKSNKIKSSHVENQVSLTPFLCCYVFFFVEGEGGSSRSQWQKHFDQQPMTFLSFFFGAEHTQLPRQQFLYNRTNNNGRPKMRIKTGALVYTFCCSASHAGLWHHQQQQHAASHPADELWWIGERGRRERTVAQ